MKKKPILNWWFNLHMSSSSLALFELTFELKLLLPSNRYFSCVFRPRPTIFLDK
ncbi:hypothetical protein BpHYR1_046426 [Brachionus plicatilis]|uniref:Uncharacterized protein n=1 Tax=Brachionus plicatilis TaxID=10195 RepID=A0A3M7PPB8_BRAPC|nr:hypothetical protein BpHYR1_046426 [Brachionus plicatilis]